VCGHIDRAGVYRCVLVDKGRIRGEGGCEGGGEKVAVRGA